MQGSCCPTSPARQLQLQYQRARAQLGAAAAAPVVPAFVPSEERLAGLLEREWALATAARGPAPALQRQARMGRKPRLPPLLGGLRGQVLGGKQ